MTDAAPTPTPPKKINTTLWFIVFVVVLAGFVIAMSLLGADKKTVTVNATDFGKRWPFPGKDSGVISCEPRMIEGKHAGMAIITFGDTRYGLNAPAFDGGGYPSALPLTDLGRLDADTQHVTGLTTIISDAVRICKDLDPPYKQ